MLSVAWLRVVTLALVAGLFLVLDAGTFSSEAQQVIRSNEIVKRLLGNKNRRKAKRNKASKTLRNISRELRRRLKKAKKPPRNRALSLPLRPGRQKPKARPVKRSLPLKPDRVRPKSATLKPGRKKTKAARIKPKRRKAKAATIKPSRKRARAAPHNPGRKRAAKNKNGGVSYARQAKPSHTGNRNRQRKRAITGGSVAFTSAGSDLSPSETMTSTRRATNPFGGGRQVISGSQLDDPTVLSVSNEPVGGAYSEEDYAENSIDLTVHFDLGSWVITPQARPALKELALALLDPELDNTRVLIAGHTDARGSNEMNLELSNQRALSIRNHLVEQFGIGPDRLEVVGFGEERPVIADDPYDGRNRRVQIVNLGETSH